MEQWFFVSEAARRVGCRPRDISDLFYNRLIPDDACPIVGGRRLIPPALLPRIKTILAERSTRRKEGEPCRN